MMSQRRLMQEIQLLIHIYESNNPERKMQTPKTNVSQKGAFNRDSSAVNVIQNGFQQKMKHEAATQRRRYNLSNHSISIRQNHKYNS